MSRPPGRSHGESFVLRLVRAAREAWGIVVLHPLQLRRIYDVDVAIWKALDEKFVSNPELRPMPALLPTPLSRDEKRRKLVEARALQAIRMLEKNELKLKRAQKLVTKWRLKVRYYDRAAAKKGS